MGEKTDTPTEHAIQPFSGMWEQCSEQAKRAATRFLEDAPIRPVWANYWKPHIARLIDRERAEAAARERERIAAWLEIEVAGSPLAKKLAAQIRARGEGER